MKLKKILILFFLFFVIGFTIYYFYPVNNIPEGIIVDKIIVLKSKHQLLAYSNDRLIVTYKIALGKNPIGDKEYEGDMKTPEGLYSINDKNPNSNFYKNLGISYPNQQDIAEANRLSKPVGGNIKVHGLKKGQGYIGRFHRWRDWT